MTDARHPRPADPGRAATVDARGRIQSSTFRPTSRFPTWKKFARSDGRIDSDTVDLSSTYYDTADHAAAAVFTLDAAVKAGGYRRPPTDVGLAGSGPRQRVSAPSCTGPPTTATLPRPRLVAPAAARFLGGNATSRRRSGWDVTPRTGTASRQRGHELGRRGVADDAVHAVEAGPRPSGAEPTGASSRSSWGPAGHEAALVKIGRAMAQGPGPARSTQSIETRAGAVTRYRQRGGRRPRDRPLAPVTERNTSATQVDAIIGGSLRDSRGTGARTRSTRPGVAKPPAWRSHACAPFGDFYDPDAATRLGDETASGMPRCSGAGPPTGKVLRARLAGQPRANWRPELLGGACGLHASTKRAWRPRPRRTPREELISTFAGEPVCATAREF